MARLELITPAEAARRLGCSTANVATRMDRRTINWKRVAGLRIVIWGPELEAEAKAKAKNKQEAK